METTHPFFINNTQQSKVSASFVVMDTSKNCSTEQFPKIDSSEFSREDAFTSILRDQSLIMDVTLQGTDGVGIPGNRTALAVHSAMFRRMLHENFVEGSTDIIKMGFESWILRAIVYWVHTDTDMSELEIIKIDSSVLEFGDCLQKLVTLSEAALFYDLKGLSNLIEARLSKALTDDVKLAVPLLSVCSCRGQAVPSSLVSLCFTTLRSFENNDFTDDDVALYPVKFSAKTLEKLLVDTNVPTPILGVWMHESLGTTEGREMFDKYISQKNVRPSFWSSDKPVLKEKGTENCPSKSTDGGPAISTRLLKDWNWSTNKSIFTSVIQWNLSEEELTNTTWVGLGPTSRNTVIFMSWPRLLTAYEKKAPYRWTLQRKISQALQCLKKSSSVRIALVSSDTDFVWDRSILLSIDGGQTVRFVTAKNDPKPRVGIRLEHELNDLVLLSTRNAATLLD